MPKLHWTIQKNLPATEKPVVFLGPGNVRQVFVAHPGTWDSRDEKAEAQPKTCGLIQEEDHAGGNLRLFHAYFKINILYVTVLCTHVGLKQKKCFVDNAICMIYFYTSTFVSISIHIVCTWHIDVQFSSVWTHCYPVLDFAVWSNPNDYTHLQMRWIGGYEC